jgi:cytochrome c-type biogenesis protein CcmH/NrfF
MASADDGSYAGSIAALVVVLAGAALAGYGFFVALDEFFSGDEVHLWLKIVASTGIGGLIVAVLTVVRGRIHESKTEEPRDVEL